MKNRKITLMLMFILSNYVLFSQDSIYFELVKDINQNPGSSSYPHFLTLLGDMFVFVAGEYSTGDELYISDGTEEGTYLLKDINLNDNGSDPHELTKLGDKIIFYATDGIHGYEPWVTDGTSDGTHILKDINIGEYASYPENLYSYDEKIVFSADDFGSMNRRLYITDGTEENTFKLKDINYEDVLNPCRFYEYNGILYFSAEESSFSEELWRSDGTEAGTYMLKDLCSEFGGSSPSDFIEYNNLLFFSAVGDNTGRELWISDGTEAGTFIYEDINETFGNGSHPSNFIVFNNKLYFTADDGVNGNRIWVTDGDTTHITLEVFQNNYSYDYLKFFKFNDLLFFTLKPTEFGDMTLWCTDGTLENTFELKANNNTSVENPNRFIKWNNKLYFVAQKQNTENDQIWVTDGTIENTKQLFHDSISGWSPIGSYDLFIFKNELYFNANFDNYVGNELYRIIDTSVSGIKLGRDVSHFINIYPNPASEKLIVNFENTHSNAIINIFDVLGKSLYKKKTTKNVENINISKLDKGVYIIVISGTNKRFSSKFVKQ